MKFNKLIISLFAILLLTGCSSSSVGLKYDEVDLIHYQACINGYVGSDDRFFSKTMTLNAIQTCKDLLPIKK